METCHSNAVRRWALSLHLNRFNQWLEANPLPASSQLMYYKLLHIFNRAGWPPSVQVDNLRLMGMTDIGAESTLIRARRFLSDAGFIQCRSGKKHSPNRYTLCSVDLFSGRSASENASISASINASENASISASENASISASHIKTNTKKKKKTYPPKPPKGALLPGEVKSYDSSELEDASFDLPEGW